MRKLAIFIIIILSLGYQPNSILLADDDVSEVNQENEESMNSENTSGETKREENRDRNIISSDNQSRTDETWTSYNEEMNDGSDITSTIRIEDIAESTSDYNYSSFGKPDPFVPPLVTDLLTKLEIPITSPLQRFPAVNLRVAGIWTLPSGERKALIMTPEDEGIISKVNDPIGRKGGKILAIEKNLIKIREFSPAADGTRQFQDTELPLGQIEIPKEDKIIINTKKPMETFEDEEKGFIEQTESEAARMQQRTDAAYDDLNLQQNMMGKVNGQLNNKNQDKPENNKGNAQNLPPDIKQRADGLMPAPAGINGANPPAIIPQLPANNNVPKAP